MYPKIPKMITANKSRSAIASKIVMGITPFGEQPAALLMVLV